jgi:preprotein translocase subunit YajC
MSDYKIGLLMRKIQFANIYLLTLAVVLLALGAFTELHSIYYDALFAGIDDKSLPYPEFLRHIFFLLGFITIISIYFIEKRETKSLSSANISLQKEINERKRVEKEREKLINELQEALDKVKTLSGLLPICSSCKKIRDENGYWNQIEVYIHDHSEADFSHSICPGCAKKLYPDLEIYDDDRV